MPPAGVAGSLDGMPVFEHVYDIPSEDELRQLVGAATPHFAFQVRDRVLGYAQTLPPDHPRQAELRAHVEWLDRLGYEGEDADVGRPDLPPRASLSGLLRPPGSAPGRSG